MKHGKVVQFSADRERASEGLCFKSQPMHGKMQNSNAEKEEYISHEQNLMNKSIAGASKSA